MLKKMTMTMIERIIYSKNFDIKGPFNGCDKVTKLTLSQTTNFRLFQTERLCRRQFQI